MLYLCSHFSVFRPLLVNKNELITELIIECEYNFANSSVGLLSKLTNSLHVATDFLKHISPWTSHLGALTKSVQRIFSTEPVLMLCHRA